LAGNQAARPAVTQRTIDATVQEERTPEADALRVLRARTGGFATENRLVFDRRVSRSEAHHQLPS